MAGLINGQAPEMTECQTRIVILPGGKPYFVELKSETGRAECFAESADRSFTESETAGIRR